MKNKVKKVIVILSFLILSQAKVDAQQRIDSLLRELKTRSAEKALDIHLRLCYEYSDEVQVLNHAKRAFAIAKKLGDSLNMVKSGRLIGWSYRRLNYLDSSINACRQVLAVAKRNSYMFEYGRLLNGLGMTYTFLAKYDEALKCHFQSLATMESIDDKKWVSISFFNIGLVYYKMLDSEKALLYNLRALELKRDLGYLEDIDILLVNIGLSYSSLHNFTVAREYVDSALTTCGDGCTNDVKIQAEFAKGMIAYRLKNVDEAEQYFLKSYQLAKDVKEERLRFDNVAMLARIYMGNGKLSKAEEILKEAEFLIHSIEYNLEVLELYKQLYILYRSTGNIDKLNLYQSRYIHLKDSVYNQDLTNNLMRIQSEHLERANSARLFSQKQALVLKDKVLLRQRWLSIFAAVVAVLLTFTLYMLLKVFYQRNQAGQLLQERVAERIREQEISHKHLQVTFEKRNLILNRVVNDIGNSILLINDLTTLPVNEKCVSKRLDEVYKINQTIGKLFDELSMYRNSFIK